MSEVLQTKKLTEVAELNPSLTDALGDDDPVSFIPMSAVTAETATTSTGEDRRYSEVSKGYTPFLDGDVLVAKITPCFENGKIAQARLSHRVGFGSTEFHVVRPRPGQADARYLLHFLRQERIRRDGERKMTGSAGQRRVPEHFLAGLNIPLPSLPEQRRIAEILDKADALRTKRRATFAQLDTLTQSIFLDMFGDHTTILKRWPTKKLGELLDFLTSGSRGWAEHYAESGELFLRIQNVQRDELLLDDIAYVNAPDTTEAKRTRVEPGDVLLSITADLGRTAVVPEGLGPAFINQHLSILRTKALAPQFLSAYLTSPVGQRQVSGRNRHAVKAGLNFDDIRSFLVPVPPAGIQQDFVSCVNSVEKLKTCQRGSLRELDALFASLQHRAFRGEL
jgi:type I restriction enzyme S subunit